MTEKRAEEIARETHKTLFHGHHPWPDDITLSVACIVRACAEERAAVKGECAKACDIFQGYWDDEGHNPPECQSPTGRWIRSLP